MNGRLDDLSPVDRQRRANEIAGNMGLAGAASRDEGGGEGDPEKGVTDSVVSPDAPRPTRLGELIRQTREDRGLTFEELGRCVGYRRSDKTLRRLERLETADTAQLELLRRVLEVLELDEEEVFRAAADASVWSRAETTTGDEEALLQVHGVVTRVQYQREVVEPEEERELLCKSLWRTDYGRKVLESQAEIGLCRPSDARLWIDPEPPVGWEAVEALQRASGTLQPAPLQRSLDLLTLVRLWRSGPLQIAEASSLLLATRVVGHRRSEYLMVEGIDEGKRCWVRRSYRGAWVRGWLDRLHAALSNHSADLRKELWRRHRWHSRATAALQALRRDLEAGEPVIRISPLLLPFVSEETREGLTKAGRRAAEKLGRLVATPISSPLWTERLTEDSGLEPVSVETWQRWGEGRARSFTDAIGRSHARKSFEHALTELPTLRPLGVPQAVRALESAVSS